MLLLMSWLKKSNNLGNIIPLLYDKSNIKYKYLSLVSDYHIYNLNLGLILSWSMVTLEKIGL
jgi:hypothetical protein